MRFLLGGLSLVFPATFVVLQADCSDIVGFVGVEKPIVSQGTCTDDAGDFSLDQSLWQSWGLRPVRTQQLENQL